MKDRIRGEIETFIINWTSDEKERKQMIDYLDNVYMKEVFEE